MRLGRMSADSDLASLVARPMECWNGDNVDIKPYIEQYKYLLLYIKLQKRES